MLKVGLVGWRGMVGSVLLERMRVEKDFDLIEPVFFTTSNVGGVGPAEAKGAPLKDGNDVATLKQMDAVISCQGGDYTEAVYPKLRAAGWKGYWIDAARTLRMSDEAVIILDPADTAFSITGRLTGSRMITASSLIRNVLAASIQ